MEKIPEDDFAMTVYDMPGQDALHPRRTPASVRAGRLRLLFILLMCALPVLASYFTYYVVRPDNAKSYGQLIQPVRPLPSIAVRDALHANKPAIPLTSLRGQWLLLSVAGGACNAVCENHLYLQRQLREALGKEKERLDWVWLVQDDVAVNPALHPALTAATVLRVPSSAIHAWLGDAQVQPEEHLFLVDPQGNLMMRFPQTLDAKKALSDMNRLLRAASSWDRAGRDSL